MYVFQNAIDYKIEYNAESKVKGSWSLQMYGNVSIRFHRDMSVTKTLSDILNFLVWSVVFSEWMSNV